MWLIWDKSKQKCWVLELDKHRAEGMEQKNETEGEWGLERQALWFRSAHEKETPGNAQKPWSGHWLSPQDAQWGAKAVLLTSPNLRLPSADNCLMWHILEWHICPALHSWMPSTMGLEYMKWFVYMHFKVCFWCKWVLKFPRWPDPLVHC